MYDTVKELIDKRVDKDLIVKQISGEFGISHREVHKRVRSMFGDRLSNLLVPSKEEMTRAVLRADNIQELKDILKVSSGLGLLYERYYGVSTFSASRKVCENYREVSPYSPTKEDNLSILMSQVIGDGHLEYKKGVPRNSLCIQHGEKQFEYLTEKVKLINKAYPTTPPLGCIKKHRHKQGHVYYAYRTNKMPNSDMGLLYKISPDNMVGRLTPLGVFLVYMDDGCLCQGRRTTVLKICNGRNEVLYSLQEHLSTYGVHSKVYLNDKSVIICDTVNITKFINNFVRPFLKYVPQNMVYKTELKI